jgi:hypothetical protein
LELEKALRFVRRRITLCTRNTSTLNAQKKPIYVLQYKADLSVSTGFAAARIHHSRTQTENNNYPCLLSATTSSLLSFVSRSWNGTDLAQPESFALSTLLPVLLKPACLVLKSKAAIRLHADRFNYGSNLPGAV